MKRIEALKQLERKVVAGEKLESVSPALSNHSDVELVYQANRGSLDAAKALHEAVLHERVRVLIDFTGRYGCQVFISDHGTQISEASSEEVPARAWLLAILRALISIEENTQ